MKALGSYRRKNGLSNDGPRMLQEGMFPVMFFGEDEFQIWIVQVFLKYVWVEDNK